MPSGFSAAVVAVPDAVVSESVVSEVVSEETVVDCVVCVVVVVSFVVDAVVCVVVCAAVVSVVCSGTAPPLALRQPESAAQSINAEQIISIFFILIFLISNNLYGMKQLLPLSYHT